MSLALRWKYWVREREPCRVIRVLQCRFVPGNWHRSTVKATEAKSITYPAASVVRIVNAKQHPRAGQPTHHAHTPWPRPSFFLPQVPAPGKVPQRKKWTQHVQRSFASARVSVIRATPRSRRSRESPVSSRSGYKNCDNRMCARRHVPAVTPEGGPLRHDRSQIAKRAGEEKERGGRRRTTAFKCPEAGWI